MNKLLETAIATVRELPDAAQEVVAKFLLDFANPEAARYSLTDAQVVEVELAKREVREGGCDKSEPEEIDPVHLKDVLESLAQAERGQFASDAEVEIAFRRFGK